MKLSEVFIQYSNREDFTKAVDEQMLKLIEENPDFCYTNENLDKNNLSQCFYNGPPIDPATGNLVGPPSKGCIFGQALQNLGWNDEAELNVKYAINALMTSTVGDTWHFNRKWSLIQSCQDAGYSWGSLKEKI